MFSSETNSDKSYHNKPDLFYSFSETIKTHKIMLSFFNSSNSDKFVLCGSSEISLFELKDKDHDADFIYDTPKLQNLSKSLSYHFNLLRILFCFLADNLKFISQLNSSLSYLNSEKRYQYIKCSATSHHQNELLVATGQASGKVSIVDFSPTSDSFLEFSKIRDDERSGGDF